MIYSTKMQQEACEFPAIIERHIAESSFIEEIVLKIKKQDFLFVCTLARGSSHHAALFAKYLIEYYLEKIVSSSFPSIYSLYKSNINLKSALIIAISQSGQSDDLVQSFLHAKQANAMTLCFVNTDNSPLGAQAQYFIPLLAGQESSVAATKSLLASLSRLIQFVTYFNPDVSLSRSYSLLPKLLRESIAGYAWDSFLHHLVKINSMYVIGRGFGFSIALEAALKLKETCAIHAEGLSGADVLHGPFELVDKNFCVFVFLQQDETLPPMLNLLTRLSEKECMILVVGTEDVLSQIQINKFYALPTLKNATHPAIDVILSLQCFYLFVANLALLRERNPDKPKNLKKVTKTI